MIGTKSLNKIDTNTIIKINKLDSRARAPERSNQTDAGADLRSIECVRIPPLCRKLIKTGLSIEIPTGYYGRIAPRSGLALKHGIDVLAGVVDSSYRGEVGIVLYNTDPYESVLIAEGDRVAQLIIERHYNFAFEETNNLSESDRSIKGFGSSGLR